MLPVSWPELEQTMYGAAPGTASEALMFKQGLFRELRDRLSAENKGEYIVDTVSRVLKQMLEGGWDSLTVPQVMEVVESVLDRVLPVIDFPGPFDAVIKPILQTAILRIAEALATKYLIK